MPQLRHEGLAHNNKIDVRKVGKRCSRYEVSRRRKLAGTCVQHEKKPSGS